MNNFSKQLAVTVIGGFLTFVAVEGYRLIKAAKGLEFKPGTVKLGVPFTRLKLETQKQVTLLPLEVTALITNNTGTALAFQHPIAAIFYRSKQVADSEISQRGHTLGAFAKDYPLTMKFEVDIETLGGSLADAAKYFLARFLGKEKAQRSIDVKLAITAYNFPFNETLNYTI
jgi:hypothetical protein